MTKPKPITAAPDSESHRRGLYKTELCQAWAINRECRYGDRCQYAHGFRDIRVVPRHPKYKTEPCFSYHFNGACPYGARCNFYHDEYEKICLVDGRFKELLEQNDMQRKQSLMNFHLNPNAPIFQPTMLQNHHDEPESLYSDTSYTDGCELVHESFFSDSGCEHNDSSDFASEPFTLGFVGGKEFLEQQHFSTYSDPNFPLEPPQSCNFRSEERRLPVFSNLTATTPY